MHNAHNACSTTSFVLYMHITVDILQQPSIMKMDGLLKKESILKYSFNNTLKKIFHFIKGRID